jgi:outer membrane protein assembly factor BamB
MVRSARPVAAPRLGPARAVLAVTALAALLLGLPGALPPAGAEEGAGCAEADHPGGDWVGLNGDVTNTRHQRSEEAIGPDQARGLTAAWTTSFQAAGAQGSPQSTPSIAGGCVYVGSSMGEVLALNADTGEPVWLFHSDRDADIQSGQIMGVSFLDGRIHFAVSSPGNPRAGALDADTGALLWITDDLTEGPQQGTTIYSSPVAFQLESRDGDAPPAMVFVTNSLGHGGEARVPYWLFDAATGELLHKGYPIPEEDMEHGYSGGGIWSTAAVDVDDRLLYVGTSDPESYTKEHPHNSAIIRIDVDPDSPTFGEVTGAQKGRFDGYISGGDRHEACTKFGDDTGILADESSPVCGQLDIGDFGASPNLFVDEEGHKVVTAMQKSGVFFAVDTRTMSLKWEAILSYPLLWGNAATAAVGDGRIFVPADPALNYGLSSIGWVDWVAPGIVDAGRYTPNSYANGVVYAPSMSGSLQAWDAETGVPLLHRPVVLDTGDTCVNLGGGVAVARNTVFAQCDVGAEGGWIVAYRP